MPAALKQSLPHLKVGFFNTIQSVLRSGYAPWLLSHFVAVLFGCSGDTKQPQCPRARSVTWFNVGQTETQRHRV